MDCEANTIVPATITDPAEVLDPMRRTVKKKRDGGVRPTGITTLSPEMLTPDPQPHLTGQRDSYEFDGRPVDQNLGNFLHKIGYLENGCLTWDGYKGEYDQWIYPTPNPAFLFRSDN